MIWTLVAWGIGTTLAHRREELYSPGTAPRSLCGRAIPDVRIAAFVAWDQSDIIAANPLARLGPA